MHGGRRLWRCARELMPPGKQPPTGRGPGTQTQEGEGEGEGRSTNGQRMAEH